jgi:hypothetical protein
MLERVSSRSNFIFIIVGCFFVHGNVCMIKLKLIQYTVVSLVSLIRIKLQKVAQLCTLVVFMMHMQNGINNGFPILCAVLDLLLFCALCRLVCLPCCALCRIVLYAVLCLMRFCASAVLCILCFSCKYITIRNTWCKLYIHIYDQCITDAKLERVISYQFYTVII